MQTNISIIFYIKRTKLTADGLAPIYMRVTIQGARIDISAKRPVDPEKWASEAGRMKQGSGESASINKYLDMLKKQVYDIQSSLIQANKPVTADTMRNRIMGIDDKRRSLVKIFEDHNDQMKALVGNGFALGTHGRFVTTLKHTKDFMKWKFNISDIDIRNVDHSFITEFEFFLRSERKCENNSAVKYIRNFGKIVKICLENDWLDKDPFRKYKPKMKEVVRVILTEEEILAIRNKVFKTDRLSLVRDIFIFSCYTGLAYVDVRNLTNSKIVKGIDGEKWIYTFRQKTNINANIPLLPVAQEIIDKYKFHPECMNRGTLLPILSNQKMNEYLKEIADVCGINKPLTFHIARHTFATTVTLTNGVPIESVSKMLGHKDIKTTQHYAKIVDRKVGEDMQILKEKLKGIGNISEVKTGS